METETKSSVPYTIEDLEITLATLTKLVGCGQYKSTEPIEGVISDLLEALTQED